MTKTTKPTTGKQSALKNTTPKVYTNLASIPTHEILRDFERVVLEYSGRLPKKGLDISGNLQRWSGADDKKGSKPWYGIIYMDGVPTIHIGNFKTGLSFNHSFNIGRSLTPAELAEQRLIAQKAKEARARETAKKQEATRKKAVSLWRKLQPASANNPYLIKKHMLPDGLKETTEGAIVAPIMNNKKLVGLQFITLEYKRFLSGSKLIGSYFHYKPVDNNYDEILLCEGISTAGAIWQLSDKKAVFASFSANNLEAIAVIVRAEFPHSKITVCADNDIREDTNKLNTGLHYATLASRKIKAFLAVPELNGKPCDFCDIWCNAQEALSGEDNV